MDHPIDIKELCAWGLSPALAWDRLSKTLLTKKDSFNVHLNFFLHLFPQWPDDPIAPAWIPKEISSTNLGRFMDTLNFKTREEFHRWSTLHFETFWELMIEKLNIAFKEPPQKICDLSEGIEKPKWLMNAKLNIAESCFLAPPPKTALIFQSEKDSEIKFISYQELEKLTNRVANSLVSQGFNTGDTLAIAMPLNIEAVAIYLGIIKMGGIVVSIADSFSADEIATRLEITKAKAIFTAETIYREGKTLALYEKVKPGPLAIVYDAKNSLRKNDIRWEDFLLAKEEFNACPLDPNAYSNILFSSGTTGTPKAIPWDHTTAIKVATDAYLHQNIQEEDILAWPTNLGWMMGPWLIFAGLINKATIALFDGSPRIEAFGKFIQDTKVTMLGVVPSLVAHWRQTQCMENLNWESIKVFSSTGESSNPEDMLYLMYLAHYKPIIEYCGGTEIGGAYLTSTVIENNYPSLFTTPAMGIDISIIDGEIAIIPPSIGLSTELLNADHHALYYEGMLKSLRRHGDEVHQYPNGLYSITGRVDDTMNLGGIKISAVEIERVLIGLTDIKETAAVAKTNQGPSQLIIFAVTDKILDKEKIKKEMQTRINEHLNPLFKIYDIVFIKELPRTATNKLMRRMLRQ